MSDTGQATLKGVITRLLAVSGVTSLVSTRIYNDVPQQATFPYILAEISSEPFSANDFSDMQHRIRVHTFTRVPSQDKALQIRSAIFSALDRQEANITLDTGNLVMIHYAGISDVFKEPDGKTWHAVIEFLARVN